MVAIATFMHFGQHIPSFRRPDALEEWCGQLSSEELTFNYNISG
jgi:hypothetical protein